MLKQTLNKGISTPIAIGIVLILVIIVGSFTWWQYGEIRKEETELPEIELPEKEEVKDEMVNQKNLEEVTKKYLENNFGDENFGGKAFCAYETLGTEEKEDIINRYLWIYCHEYYLEDERLREGTGISIPVALYIQREGGYYHIVEHKRPESGESYGESIREIFPEEHHVKIFPQPPDYSEYNQRARRLSEETKKEAEVYFKIK